MLLAHELLQGSHRNVLVLAGPLDKEGRCLLTCIGNLAIYNVYIPNDGPYSVNLAFKLQVLRALLATMTCMRNKGYKIILCGDLNLSYRTIDVCPADVRVDISECLRLAALPQDADEREHTMSQYPRCIPMCEELAAVWSSVKQILATRRAEEVEIFVPSQNRKEKKWRVFVEVASSKPQKVALGNKAAVKGSGVLPAAERVNFS